MNQGFLSFLFLSDLGKGKRKKFCPFFCMYYFPCTRGSFVYQEDSVVEISPNGIPNFFCKCISEANSLFFFFSPLMHSHYMCLFLMHSAVENVLIICASFRVFFFLLLLFSRTVKENSSKIWISRQTFGETKAICRPWRQFWRTAWNEILKEKLFKFILFCI